MWKERPHVIENEFTLPVNYEEGQDLTDTPIHIQVGNGTKIPLKVYVSLIILKKRPTIYIEINEEVKE